MWRYPPSRERHFHSMDIFVFSIFVFDETDFCNSFSWIGLLAFACDRDCCLLGHELREYEGAFESRIFGGSDFHVAVRGDVFVVARNFA